MASDADCVATSDDAANFALPGATSEVETGKNVTQI
jgi:hypothetical protein